VEAAGNERGGGKIPPPPFFQNMGAAMKTKKILIIEDDVFSRGVMEKILESHNYKTSSCATAEEAVIKLEEESFGILITDLQMGGMDGLELIREARRIYPEIPTILVTGLASDEIRLKAKEEGVNGFFSKPIEWGELIALLEVLTKAKKDKSQNTNRNDGKGKYSYLQRGIFFAVMLFLLTLFIIRISEAQEAFPKQNRPNLRMESQGRCWKSSSFALTEEQMKALESLQRAYQAEATPKYRELMTLRLELQCYVLDKSIKPQDIMERHKKLLALQTELETLSFSYQMKAQSILTREQLERLPQDCFLEMGIGYGAGVGIGRGPRRGSRW
jgi:CheY-like chemotaxis protein